MEKRGVLRALAAALEAALCEPTSTPELEADADGARDPPLPPTPSAEKSEFEGARDPIEEVTFENHPATARRVRVRSSDYDSLIDTDD